MTLNNAEFEEHARRYGHPYVGTPPFTMAAPLFDSNGQFIDDGPVPEGPTFLDHPDHPAVAPSAPDLAARLREELQRARGDAGPALAAIDAVADRLRAHAVSPEQPAERPEEPRAERRKLTPVEHATEKLRDYAAVRGYEPEGGHEALRPMVHLVLDAFESRNEDVEGLALGIHRFLSALDAVDITGSAGQVMALGEARAALRGIVAQIPGVA